MSSDYTTGDRRDPVGPVSEIRSRARRGDRISGDEFGRLFSAGDDDLLYENMRQRQRRESLRPVDGAE